jgi:hydroxypyruvate isomerase
MIRESRNRTLIKAHDPAELRYWATILRCTELEVLAAVRAVGSNAEDVRKYLEANPCYAARRAMRNAT